MEKGWGTLLRYTYTMVLMASRICTHIGSVVERGRDYTSPDRSDMLGPTHIAPRYG